jgi:hypothetical protein
MTIWLVVNAIAAAMIVVTIVTMLMWAIRTAHRDGPATRA